MQMTNIYSVEGFCTEVSVDFSHPNLNDFWLPNETSKWQTFGVLMGFCIEVIDDFLHQNLNDFLASPIVGVLSLYSRGNHSQDVVEHLHVYPHVVVEGLLIARDVGPLQICQKLVILAKFPPTTEVPLDPYHRCLSLSASCYCCCILPNVDFFLSFQSKDLKEAS